jgi:hypothetical protein
MAELLVKFTGPTRHESGELYWPAVYCGLADDGLWEGWIEFKDEKGHTLRTPRETEQPNRDFVAYWAQGLTATYLEGALQRALKPIDAPARQGARRLVSSPPRSAPRPAWEVRPRDT